MCGGNQAAQRAADASAAEAARQAQLERDRLAQEAADAKAEAERRAAEDQKRYEDQLATQKAEAEAQRKAIEDANAATLAAQQKIEDQRKADREADLKRQDDERKAAEQLAADNAKKLTDYSTNRQDLIDNARSNVSGAFAPFDDSFYKNYADTYVGTMTPQLEQDYKDAKRAATFNFANRGTLDSTAAARAFGRLDQQRESAGADIAQRAQSAASAFRGDVDSQRQQLLNGIFSAANSAPPITVDNIGDANASLRSLSASLNSPVSLAASAASTVTPPAFGSLTNPFGASTYSPYSRATTVSAGTNGAYTSSGGTSGRLVN
jgi:hypothetical protein